MDYYANQENVAAYIQMAADTDGKLLVDVLRRHLPGESTVLELGMGPGKDLLLLTQYYRATGSDFSGVFVERFRKLHPELEVRRLDAITIATDRRFAAIYSNKVLSHLAPSDLRASFQRQAQVLEGRGLALHSFWYGDHVAERQGLLFAYYREDTLSALFEPEFEVLDSERYSEFESDDSLYVVLRRR